MIIYIGHSSEFDFRKELYNPIRESDLNLQHKIILPHEKNEEVFNTMEILKKCNLVIAEVSYPSTGLGIELGWANFLERTIVCIYKKGSKISSSLKVISRDFIEYTNEDDLVKKLKSIVK